MHKLTKENAFMHKSIKENAIHINYLVRYDDNVSSFYISHIREDFSFEKHCCNYSYGYMKIGYIMNIHLWKEVNK